MSEIRIPFQPNKLVYLIAGFFSLVCAGILGTIAASNDRGVVIARFFEFSAQGATILYWALTAAAIGFVVIVVLLLVKSMGTKREIILTASSITAPKSGVSSINITVEYADISQVAVQQVQNVRILNIEHINGKLSIASSMLPNKSVFEDLVSQLNLKLKTS